MKDTYDPVYETEVSLAKNQYSVWYGEESTGNYMGIPASGQPGLSGGTSVFPNAGLLISPPIQVSSQPVMQPFPSGHGLKLKA